MGSSPRNKVDSGLSSAWDVWERNPDLAPDAGISVSLSFSDDLPGIEALGFETHTVYGDQVLGVVRFKDIPKLQGHAGVLWMAAGERPSTRLDTAVRDIRARATAPISGAPVDGVWHADISTGTLTSIPKATGKGVIVAIMDTGIDYTHPMFIGQVTPTKTTRIFKIWDQGLTPTAVTDCPDKILLSSPDTYGVEFDSHKIEAALNGGTPLDHKDCNGHGTHVAGIAAGGTTFVPLFADASKVGVAPEADIIVVKHLDTPDHVFYRLADNSNGGEVSWMARFQDGVLYCLRTARKAEKSVVINMSFGNNSMPGDGLDDKARWVDALLDPSAAASNNNFPTQAIIVRAAGNEGGGGSHLGRIEVPDSGEIVVPLALVDFRGTAETQWTECAEQIYKPNIGAYFWYRPATAPLAVQFAIRTPHGAGFSADVSAGAATKLELGVKAVVGPPANDIWAAFSPNVHRVTIDHQAMPPVPHPSGGTVQRQYARIFLSPKEAGGSFSYNPGIYEVRIRAPKGTVFFMTGQIEYWSTLGSAMSFRLNDKMQDGTPADSTHISALHNSTILDPLGQNVITVANYNDTDGDTTNADHESIWDSSSLGPLRDYSDPAHRLPVIPKPDIAAPGVRINSAAGRDIQQVGINWPWWYLGARFQEKTGTSMAAPMITGAVALLLEKNANLSATDVRNHLSAAPRAAVNPPTPPASTNAYGVGMVDVLSSHNHV